MANIGFHSRRKVYFQVILGLFVLSILGYLFFLGDGFLVRQTIASQNKVLKEQTAIADSYKALTGYNKLQAVKLLEGQQAEIPRSDHIKKVIQMLEDIKDVQGGGSGSIILSDFKVGLDSISLKGQVSSLLLLYYSNAEKGIVSLLDRFSQLDFINNIRVQTYDRVGESGYFQFVLEANVTNDATTDTGSNQ
ncbi:MAG: hypothetical protein WC875_01645 [Candidatus Absconditabacterales bacterium]